MKYGVVSRDRILKDLLQWTDMYGAGRLHKPVKILKSDEEIENAIVVNRENAVRTGAYSDVYFLYLLTHSLTHLLLHSAITSTGSVQRDRNLLKNRLTVLHRGSADVRWRRKPPKSVQFSASEGYVVPAAV